VSRRRHNAFTTIELLVAISILVILAGMVFVGFKVVGTGGKTRSTKAALESARAMLGEIDATGGMASIKEIYQKSYTTTFLQSAITVPAHPNSYPGASAAPDPIPAPTGNVSEDANNVQRYTSEAVVRTQAVMGRLIGSPANRSTLAQIPSDRLLKKPSISSVVYLNSPNGVPNPPVLVDAWSNPIIYVPPAGLSGVNVADKANQIITSVGLGKTTTFMPGATGFWASAGPDGDFTKGDDNLYSFE
jgi:type II secretory pathway pseudopilin PulG